MLKLLVLVIILGSIAAGGYYLYQQKSNSYKTTSDSVSSYSPQPETSSDACEVLTKGSDNLPPIYSGMKWESLIISDYEIPTSTGAVVKEGCVARSSIAQDKIAREARKYYEEASSRLNWTADIVSDGSGGGLDTYRKNMTYLLFKYETIGSSGEKIITIFYSR